MRRSRERLDWKAVVPVFMTVVGFIAALLTLPRSVIVLVMATLLFCLMGVGFQTLRSPRVPHRVIAPGGLSPLAARFGPSCEFASSERVVKECHDLERQVFGHGAFSLTKICQWWRKYQRGIVVARRNDRTVGLVGLWPISRAAWANLSGGKITELELGIRSVRPEPEGECWWYIGSILVATGVSRPLVVGALFEFLMTEWISGLPRGPHSFVASAYTAEGKRLLEKLGFVPSISADEHPIFVMRSQTSAQLRSTFDQMFPSLAARYGTPALPVLRQPGFSA